MFGVSREQGDIDGEKKKISNDHYSRVCVCLWGSQGRGYGGVWVSETEIQLTHVN